MGPQLQERTQKNTEAIKPNLTGIPTQMRLDFEERSGLSFDDVRVHYNSEKPAQLQALAYTQGTHVYVGPGQERYLRHELGHVVQQKAGRVRPTRLINGLPVNDQPQLEWEADSLPLQRMEAHPLRMVIQMALPMFLPQLGNNCGFHALARVIRQIDNGPLTEDTDFASTLTMYAAQAGYTVVGEAFDPYALMQVGNEYCDQKGIDAKCEVIPFVNKSTLTRLMQVAKKTGCFVLIPYYPEPDSDSEEYFAPAVAPAESQDAHWAAIDTRPEGADGYELYEGNIYGSGQMQRPVTVDELFASNQSLTASFNWSRFYKVPNPDATNFRFLRDWGTFRSPEERIPPPLQEALIDRISNLNAARNELGVTSDNILSIQMDEKNPTAPPLLKETVSLKGKCVVVGTHGAVGKFILQYYKLE